MIGRFRDEIRIGGVKYPSGANVRLIRIVDRYIFTEAFGLFVLGFGGFLGFLVVNMLFLEAENILDPTKPGLAIVLRVLLDTPYFATLALPISVMFATLMSMGRLAKDLELTAMFTNGVSLYRLLLPFLLLSGIAVALSYYTNEYLATAAAAKKEEILERYPGARQETQRGEPDPFIAKLDQGQFVSALTFDKEQGVLSKVVFDDWAIEGGTSFVVADRGQTEERDLILGQSTGSPAIIYELDPTDRLCSKHIREPTERIALGVDLKTQITQMKTPQELTQTELARQTKQKKELGENPAEDLTDFHLRFSGPFASLAFALVAMPLSLRAPRDERLLGLILCFVLGMIYYTIFFISKLMGYNEVLVPWLAAWMKDIVFGLIAAVIFLFSRK